MEEGEQSGFRLESDVRVPPFAREPFFRIGDLSAVFVRAGVDLADGELARFGEFLSGVTVGLMDERKLVSRVGKEREGESRRMDGHVEGGGRGFASESPKAESEEAEVRREERRLGREESDPLS